MIWLFSNIDHPRRRFIGLSVIQYSVLNLIYWSRSTWTDLGAIRVANALTVSDKTVSRIFVELEDMGLIERMGQLKKVTNKAIDLLDIQEFQVPALGLWAYTTINHEAIRKLNHYGTFIRLDEYCYLDLVKQSMLSTEYGDLGWCNHRHEVFAKLLDISESGSRKIQKRMEERGLLESSDKGVKVTEFFLSAFKDTGVERKEASINAVEEEDSVENDAIRQEVYWRLDREVGPQKMLEMFPDQDILAVQEEIADAWIDAGKEIVPHPRSGKSRNWPYQSCLKGFKTWVQTYAHNQQKEPIRRRPSKKAKKLERDAMIRTLNAYGNPTHLRIRKRPWPGIDETAMDRFLAIPGFSVEEKRKYIAYCATDAPGTGDINDRLGFIDRIDMEKALDKFEYLDHVGRPRDLDWHPPTYTPVKTNFNINNWRTNAPQNYFVDHDKEHKPIRRFDRQGSPLDDWWRSF